MRGMKTTRRQNLHTQGFSTWYVRWGLILRFSPPMGVSNTGEKPFERHRRTEKKMIFP